jgi:hypothetical protein
MTDPHPTAIPAPPRTHGPGGALTPAGDAFALVLCALVWLGFMALAALADGGGL